jgi:glucose/arabinose dehydrogenase
MKYFQKLVLKFCLQVMVTVSCLSAATLPDGFQEEVVVDGINGGTAFTIVPDGRVFYIEQTGSVRCIVDGRLLPEPLLDLSGNLDTYWERGLIGITHHPEFPLVPYFYLVYVVKEPYTHHRISRFTLVGNMLDPASEVILLEGDDQSKTTGKVPWGHQGGPIKFGPDGKLYIGIGEHTEGPKAQVLDTLQGKILRINPDGSIPTDNPFYRQTYGKYRAIWAYGIRNPYGLAFHPDGRLYESDVGQSAFEEINQIIGGGNYGWPEAEGFSEQGEFVNPVHAYPPAIGRCICGAMFYPPSGNFPTPWKGKFFYVDWASNWIKAIDVDHPDEALTFGMDLDDPVWIDSHPDGSIWVLNRGTRWRDGKVYQDGTGSLVRISFTGSSAVAKKVIEFPSTLSKTGVFSDLSQLKPAKGFVELEMNAPVWLPGVKQRQWLLITKGSKIGFSTWDH